MPNSFNERRLKELHALIIKRQALQLVLMFIQLGIIIGLFTLVLYLAFDINY